MTIDFHPSELLPNTWAQLEALPARPTIQQAAEALGMSLPTVRRRITEGVLKAYRVGPRAIRLDKESLIEFASQPIEGGVSPE